MDVREVYQGLSALLGQDDLGYVITAAPPWIGCGYEAMNDWLKRHIG